MRPGLVSLAGLAMAVATPALAQPVIVTGDPPQRPSSSSAPDCVVEPAGAASARIRCRTRDTTLAPGSEMTFLVSAQSASAAPRCLGAEVVRPPGAHPSAKTARPRVVEGASGASCGA